ncbi:MAG TPA: DUF5686 and carboxypeptidase regulatory-like domain-containing protein, partial [Flavisolibacter sp.]|nr:DUF5686 and carboxypeptidase regulatory-like domain-containing protein [Flavisolibacter sp.]
MKPILFLLLMLSVITASAGNITGTITDSKGTLLSYASIVVRGTSKGAVANSQGKYSLFLEPGTYTIVCQFVGYRSEEKKITVGNENLVLDFRLSMQELKMDEVVIKRGDDPALEIMRQTIKKRDYYNEQVDSLTVDVYIKGLMRSRGMPDRFFGQKIDKDEMASEGIDSAGKGILFLSESVTKVALAKPDKVKFEVVSSRESGGGYGLSFPFFINFYTNNVSVFANNVNPRGFVSPLADNAFHYYKFRYEGNFFEGDKMINRIKVTPRRKNEPLFEGYVQIIDGEWRIHSLELSTTKQYQLELLDTLRITQLHAPVNSDVWRTQNQVVYLAMDMFGFDITGNFLNVYTNYNLDPGFGKKHFGRVLMVYDSGALKKDSSYWASTRPVPLEPDEKTNFVFKDSVSRAYRDSFSRMNFDSLNKARKPVKFKNFFLGNGVSRNRFSRSAIITYRLEPLIKQLQYNTVEGLAIRVLQSLDVRPRKGNNNYTLALNTRYGLSNQHLNSFLTVRIAPKRENFRSRYLQLSGGKRLTQFNKDNPIDPLTNSLYTLLGKRNYMKLYENWFGEAEYYQRLENGFRWKVNAFYEDRLPVENSTDFSFFRKESVFLPNHPYELAGIPFNRHQALVATVTLSYQPGQMYIQYPHGKQSIGSSYPTFEVEYAKGIDGFAGSDVDFDKWKASVYDNMNFRLGGEFRYRFSAGGFLNSRRVEIPDFRHFNGNQTFYNFKYLNSFQLAPYYRYSNTEELYALGHVEHHFNGLLTNKIPLLNKLKWTLVAGSNAFYVNRSNYYVEAFAGLENIFKLF